MKRRTILTGAMLAFVSPYVGSVKAHSLDSLEEELLQTEKYFQVKDSAPPNFVLDDAFGKTVALAALRGKVIVLHFVYTRCPDVCPLHAEKIAEVQKMVNITPMKGRVVFASITTDPEHDTPQVMQTYGRQHGLDSSNWIFLTKQPKDSEDATRKLAERFGHGFATTSDGLQLHGTVTHVIGPDGRWRANFHGLRFQALNLVLLINGLVNVSVPHQESRSFWSLVRSLF